MNYKQVASRLGDEVDKNQVQQLLQSLLKRNLLGEMDRGKYHFIHQMTYVEGYLQITQKGSGYLLSEKDGEEDIYIAPKYLNKALNGDKVMVQVFAKKKKSRPEGGVVEILQRARTHFVGIIEFSRDYSLFIPDDKRLYVDILVPNDELNGAEDLQKVIVEMVEWPERSRIPTGRVAKVLGTAGEHEAEMHAIIAEFGFDTDFSDEVLAELEQVKGEITKEEIKKRRDFRQVLTFTIDPDDAKDFDDALSIRVLPDQRYEIGVHIADVSHYVQPGTTLDQSAFDRGTSVYLVDRTIPMLPEKLSNELCSLRPLEEKLTFSAVFEMDMQGNIYQEWFGKTIIKSAHRFAYEQAQEIIESNTGIYAEELQVLNQIALKLKEARFKNGAISFETEEVKFRLDEKGKPIELYKKVRKDAHKLIEEFMLLANKKVAMLVGKQAEKEDKSKRNPFVYRMHDLPQDDKLMEFSQFIRRFGHQIKTEDPNNLAKAFNRLLEQVEGKPEQNIIQNMAIRTMAKAVYTTRKSSHYGLAFDFYTHFTSPIRRYPDLMVHRLLQEFLESGKVKADATQLEKRCKHSSEMEQKAADAERASVKYKQAEYLQQFIGRVFDGIISGVTEWGIYVELPENKCEGMIRLSTMNDDFYEYDEDKKMVVGKRKKRKFQMGDPIKIVVKKTDPIKRTIDFNLANR